MERISRLYPYRVLDSLQSLLEAIQTSSPHVIVPCDDGAVWQLHALHQARPELRTLIERSLGPASTFEIASNRADFMDIAGELGIRIPETRRVQSLPQLAEAFAALGNSAFLKLDKTTGGKGVRSVTSLDEAREAWESLRRAPDFLTACGRWLALHDAVALWNLQHRGEPRMTLQRFIDGRPANAMLACKEGRLLALTTVEVLSADIPTGAALAVRMIENKEIRHAAECIARRLQLSGFHGLDFMLEHKTGHAYLIELNPRCTQLGHLETPPSGDLAGAFARAFNNTPAPVDPPREPLAATTVLFFPQALSLSRYADYCYNAHIDVPWEEPGLVRELMRSDWRQRTLLGRLSYAMRSRERVPVFFIAPEPD